MYTRCLFCAGDLGRNEAVEAFPVGRRLAYDAAKGRLWVVCPRCARWNLTPLEERWEAIEQAERLFRGARVRASSEHVGLARVPGGTELVRIGRPTLPEFISWRYADVFARRRQRAVLWRGVSVAVSTTVAVALLGGLVAGGVGAATLFLVLKGAFEGSYDPDREQAAQSAADDEIVTSVVITQHPVSLRRGAVRRAVLHHEGDDLALTFPFGRAERTLVGERAERATSAMLTHLNAAGASREFVSGALDQLLAAGSADAFIDQVARRRASQPSREWGARGLSLGIASAQTRLALEIAISEGSERRALEGALAELERAWQDAERVAAIADDLLLPDRVERAFARLRGVAGRGG